MFDAKSVSDKTPEPYQEWLKAINESLDKQVEETDYQKMKLFKKFFL